MFEGLTRFIPEPNFGEVLTGECIGIDENGEDLGGARFIPDGGDEIEDNNMCIQFLDGPMPE